MTHDIIKEFGKIARRYLYGWFVFDFVAIIPLQFIHDNLYAIKLTRILHIGEFLELFDLSKIGWIFTDMSQGGTREEQASTKYLLEYLYKVFRLLLIALLMCYFLGMAMYIISSQANPDDTPKKFIIDNNFGDISKAETVIRCMYYILTTLTTVGFGDFLAYSNAERIYNMIVELVGVAFYSYIMGNFIEIVANYEKKVGIPDRSAELTNWLTLLDRFTDGRKLDKSIVTEIEEYYNYFWEDYKLACVSSDNPNLASAPKYTKRDVNFFSNKKNS